MNIGRSWIKFFRLKQPETPVVAYTTDAAYSSLFTYSPRHAEVTASRKPRGVLYMSPQPGLIRLTKMERLGGHLLGLGPVYADVRNASMEFIGVPGSESLVEAQSKADAPNETQARRLLQSVKIEPKQNRLRFFNPPGKKDRHCLTEFTVLCPSERPVTVRGRYSAVRLSDLGGGADIETTHARITLLNVMPLVSATVQEGIIDYSGDQGSVRLFAGWELNLNFTSPVFAGKMEATAEGPVRLLLPERFTTSFEASAAKDAAFVCRADIGAHITHRERAGRAIYSFGVGEPKIRLVSLKGPIVIDNFSNPEEQAAARAMSRI